MITSETFSSYGFQPCLGKSLIIGESIIGKRPSEKSGWIDLIVWNQKTQHLLYARFAEQIDGVFVDQHLTRPMDSVKNIFAGKITKIEDVEVIFK